MNENRPNFLARLKAGLSKTRLNLANNLEQIFCGYSQIDASFYQDLEDTLIMADVGMETTTFLIEKLKKTAVDQHINDPIELQKVLIREITDLLLIAGAEPLNFRHKNQIYLIVGVNGVGKTTSIAKLADRFLKERHRLLLIAGDTFRAAACEQLMLWGERLGVPVIHHQEGADPAAVVFDGLAAAKARNVDTILIDTAGRLHTKINLMEELKKIKRVVAANLNGRNLQTLLVVDATTGQNAVNQMQIFHDALGISGLILTKLDGTAKGGIILAIASRFRIPIQLIGVGEKSEDLQDFDPTLFTQALFDTKSLST